MAAPELGRTTSMNSQGSASSQQAEPLELGDIGEAPFNEYHASFIGNSSAGSSFYGYMSAGGYAGKLSRAAPSCKLREALATTLDVPMNGLSLVYEGKDLDDQLTLRDNGILEPGPAARKRGQGRIGIMFMLTDGIELGAAKRDKQEAQEATQKVLDEKLAAEKKAREEAKREREEAEEKARLKAAEEAREEEQNRAAVADRITLRCRLLDADETMFHELQTLLSITVRDLALQICRERNMRQDAHHVGNLVIHRVSGDNALPAGSSLREVGLKNGDEIVYFWGG